MSSRLSFLVLLFFLLGSASIGGAIEASVKYCEGCEFAIKMGSHSLVCRHHTHDSTPDQPLLSSDEQEYELIVQVASSAVQFIRDEQLNLIVSKGFGVADSNTFNTAWMHESCNQLFAGTYTYKWKQRSKAAFISKVATKGILKDFSSDISPEFLAGDFISYNGAAWKDPETTVLPPDFSLKLDEISEELHPVLEAPYTDRNGGENWAPYYYGTVPMGGSTLTGHPVIQLRLTLQASISANAFVGVIMAGTFAIDYGSQMSKTVCVYTNPGEVKVRIKANVCSPSS